MQSKSFNLLDQQTAVRKIINDEDSDTFYILNISDKQDSKGKATRELAPVHFAVTIDGVSRIIRVPPSWVPVDAGMQASKKAIAASGEFMRVLTAGAIAVLDDETGRRIIEADDHSREEYSRVMSVAQNVNGSGEGWQSFNKEGNSSEPDDPWANVTPSVKLNVEEVEADNMSQIEFKSFLRRETRSISELDRKYIAEKLPSLHS